MRPSARDKRTRDDEWESRDKRTRDDDEATLYKVVATFIAIGLRQCALSSKEELFN